MVWYAVEVYLSENKVNIDVLGNFFYIDIKRVTLGSYDD